VLETEGRLVGRDFDVTLQHPESLSSSLSPYSATSCILRDIEVQLSRLATFCRTGLGDSLYRKVLPVILLKVLISVPVSMT
jgi:hypothetical protein